MTSIATQLPTLEIKALKFFPTGQFNILFKNYSRAINVPIAFQDTMNFEESLSNLGFQKSVYSEAQTALEKLCSLLFEYAKKCPLVYDLSLIRRNRYDGTALEIEAAIFEKIEEITAPSMALLNQLYFQAM